MQIIVKKDFIKTKEFIIKKGIKEFIKKKQTNIKSQQRFRSEKRNVLTEKVNKIVLSANEDKRIQQIDQENMHMEQVRI